jgi:hypothetical protein
MVLQGDIISFTNPHFSFRGDYMFFKNFKIITDENGNIKIVPATGEGETVVNEPKKPRKVYSHRTSVLYAFLITTVFAFLYFFFKLPAINLKAPEFYLYIILCCAVFSFATLFFEGFSSSTFKGYVTEAKKRLSIPFYIIILCVAVTVVGTLVGLKIFRAKDWANLIYIEEGNFAEEVAETDFSNIPLLDKASANVLANRKLGQLSDLVSQFEVYPDSYQINYRNRPVRVTFLTYGDFFKWLNNQKSGIPAYIVIDMVTQEANVVRTSEGIRYSPSELFFRKISRHMRFKFPTKMIADINFEIDDEGRPWWIGSVVDKRIGLFGGADMIGAIMVDANTGEAKYVEVGEIPTWIDRVYISELILSQYDNHGLYHKGFLNSIFGQRGCTETTQGYNYLAMNDDVWVYTGITSVSGDQGNIGFILVNQRTKEAKYYPCAGAEEFSAMNSAQGAVQQFKYTATFPLLLNIEGQPTYFMALKDASQLVKMYAMVNVEQYQMVATGSTVKECARNYEKLLNISGIQTDSVGAEEKEIRGTIVDIRTIVLEGTSQFFVKLDSFNSYFRISAAEIPTAVLLNIDQRVRFVYSEAEDGILTVSEIK